MNGILVTHNLSKYYKDLSVVDHLNLHVPQGSIYGFLGLNGAGKTTTIRMLLGLIHPTAGEISMFGESYQGAKPEILSRIGALVETPSYYPHLTGKENLRLVCQMRRLPENQVDHYLRVTHLEKDSHRLVGKYSLGMRQRLGLAMALLGSPEVLILDEPTNSLDPSGIHEIRALLSSLPRETGATVFLSSHLLSEVEQMATCIGILQQGSLVFEGSPQELQAYYPEEILIRLNHPEAGKPVLANLGYPADQINGQALRVTVKTEPEIASLNLALVNAGISVFGLERSPLSLEEIFLRLTRSNTIGG